VKLLSHGYSFDSVEVFPLLTILFFYIADAATLLKKTYFSGGLWLRLYLLHCSLYMAIWLVGPHHRNG